MTALSDKIENGLNEARTLVLGVQVLIGFQYQSFFQTGFEKLARPEQLLKLGSLSLMLLSMAWLIAPVAYHRLVVDGQTTPGLDRFVTRALGIALAPFSLALAADFYIAGALLNG